MFFAKRFKKNKKEFLNEISTRVVENISMDNCSSTVISLCDKIR